MPVPPNPSVVIKFDGAMVYQFQKREMQGWQHLQLCEIGIVKAPKHTLKIRHEIAFDDISPEIYYMSSPTDVDEKSFEISVAGIGEPQGVDRLFSVQLFDPQDFRWAVDLECHKYHNTKLCLQKTYPTQKFRILQGLFYTYSRIPVLKVRKQGMETETEEIQIASPIGCNFYLNADEVFSIKNLTNGKPLITVTPSPGRKDIITILNTPNTREIGDEDHDFPAYYESVVVPDKCTFDIRKSGNLPPDGPLNHKALLLDGTPDYPCPNIVLGRQGESSLEE